MRATDSLWRREEEYLCAQLNSLSRCSGLVLNKWSFLGFPHCATSKMMFLQPSLNIHTENYCELKHLVPGCPRLKDFRGSPG